MDILAPCFSQAKMTMSGHLEETPNPQEKAPNPTVTYNEIHIHYFISVYNHFLSCVLMIMVKFADKNPIFNSSDLFIWPQFL